MEKKYKIAWVINIIALTGVIINIFINGVLGLAILCVWIRNEKGYYPQSGFNPT